MMFNNVPIWWFQYNAGNQPPADSYITEDSVYAYITEDGSAFYVTET